MNTPVYDFVTEYCNRDMSRMHMPGHKGRSFLGCEERDITEISGADVLHQVEGILKESQENAASLFGAGRTLYSTEGSSLCIKVMLAVLLQSSKAGKDTDSMRLLRSSKSRRDKAFAVLSQSRKSGKNQADVPADREEKRDRAYILAGRNVHRAMIDACALLDLDIDFILDTESGNICAGKIEARTLSNYLERAEQLPIGVYITSPNYLGEIADIAGLSSVCRQFGLPLVVDNAHGAYLKFLHNEKHPLEAGAVMCCDSAHKTLPVLTGGAYLHIAKEWADRYGEYAERMMAVFASTSPSYLILQSLDLCNRYLAENYAERLENTVRKNGQIKQRLKDHGIPLLESEALKIVIDVASAGYSGIEIAEEMRACHIECEYADEQYVVLMISVENREEDYLRLERWAEEVSALRTPRSPISYPAISYGKTERVCSIREAVFGESETVSVENAVGRICAAETIACPPAVPIAISGEKITEEMVVLFQRYGIRQVAVLRDECL